MLPNEGVARYISRVCSHLFWPPYRRRVRRELCDHIASRMEYLQSERGMDENAAAREALRRLGDPDALGRSLRHARFPPRYVACLAATMLIWAAIAACAAYLFLLLHSV